MCYWIIPSSRIPIGWTTIQAITSNELKTDVVWTALIAYDTAIKDKLGTSPPDLWWYIKDKDEEAAGIDNVPYEPEVCLPDVNIFEADQYDELLLAKPLFPHEIVLLPAQIIVCKRDQDENPNDNYNANP